MKKTLLVLFPLVLCCSLSAQQNIPNNGQVFRDDVVPSVYITLPSDSLAAVLDPANQLSDHHYNATFVFANGTIRDTLTNVGFRLRGNTSRTAAKKSFKVSFNEFESGKKYHGLEKMNINGEHNDPSMIRSKLCFDMLNYLEVPASRVNHVRLYINGAYFGLYANVEHIDEEFTQSRYGSKGNLYKCIYGADLAYRGSSANSYKTDYYELKQTVGATDYADLAHFSDVLNNTPEANFECALEKVFNVNSYLKSVVMDVLTGNWDGPNYNKNNFYLYSNPKTSLFEYIPYDLDNTFGVDFLERDWATRDIYTWSKGNSGRPLFDKIITRKKYKEKFTYLLQKTLEEYFTIDSMSVRVNTLKGLISTAAVADTYRTLDYGYTINDFNNSFGYFSQDHVKYGLVDYITRRENAALSQIDTVENVGQIPYWYTYDIDYVNDSITFLINVKGEEMLTTAEVVYNWDSQSAIWTDTLKKVAWSEGVYTTTIAWHPTLQTIGFLFRLSDTEVSVQFPSCDMYSIQKTRSDLPMYINELMANNESGIEDEEGKNEDWIELYYGGEGFVNPGVLYLTDDLANPIKFPLVLGTVAPKSFHLIWADDDEDDGRFHANFKLGKGGEDLALFDVNGAMLDWIRFGEQTGDVSYGRVTDGGDKWQFFDVPTPDASNTGVASIPNVEENGIKVYPNPSNGTVRIENFETLKQVEVYNQSGRLISVVSAGKDIINLGEYIPGVYILKLIGDNRMAVKRLVIID
ncbi:MAG: CotH kinase family protein [Bacteroidia bacterium]